MKCPDTSLRMLCIRQDGICPLQQSSHWLKSLTQALFTILCLAELGVESFQMYSRLGCCKVCLQAYCIFLTKNIFFPSDWRYRLSSGAGAGDAFRFQWFLCTFKALLKARNVSDIGKSSITCLVPFYLVCFCVQELLDSIQSISIFYIFVSCPFTCSNSDTIQTFLRWFS